MTSHFVSWILLLTSTSASIFDQSGKGKCVPIEIDLCKNLPYNYTYHPNTLLHNDQNTLQTHTEHFKPLMKTKCNPHIHFFICSVFAPMCPTSMPQAVRSCRSVCEQVKSDCVSILEEFGISWPEPLNCSQFPEAPELCMSPTEEESLSGMQSVLRKPSSGLSKPSGCPSDLVDLDPMDRKAPCAFSCNSDVMFTTDTKKTARFWSMSFAVANTIASLFAFLTFLIDRKRFRFPERCVLYLSLCLFLSTLPYLSPLLVEPAHRACQRLLNGRTYLAIATMDNGYCTASFLLHYFFSTAASLWWLMFAFTLYLSGGRKWVPEGIEACSSYVHFVAWGGSALATIIVLLFNEIDASEMTSICTVGNQNPNSLLGFVLMPKTVTTIAGSCFIVGAFASMCRERISFRQRGTDTSKLEKLMLKMGLFCALFIIPNVVEIVCQSYNYMMLTQWSRSTIGCKTHACHRPQMPQPEIYITALLAGLCTGFSCLTWVFSSKTLRSWKDFIFCGICSSAPTKTAEPSSRPLLEPPTAPLPQPPVTYMQMTTNPQTVWRTNGKVV